VRYFPTLPWNPTGGYNQNSVRIFSNSAMAVLIVVALFWGNCLTCPQMMPAHQPDHSCCHHKKTDASQQCHSQDMQQFLKADPGVHAAPVPVMAAEAVQAVQAVPAAGESLTAPVGIEHAPPDLLSLTSSLRI
jgi:hypothetical protein